MFDGATLQFDTSATAVSEPISIVGTGVGGQGAINKIGTAGLNLSGLITLTGLASIQNSAANLLTLSNASLAKTGDFDLTVTGGTDTTINSVIANGGSGSATLNQVIKNGGGTLTLTAANLYQGNTVINAGLLSITNAGALGTTGAGTQASGGSLALSDNIALVNQPLSLAGVGTGSGALTNLSGTNSYTGTITAVGSAGIGSLAGTLTTNGTINLGFGGLTLLGAATPSSTASSAAPAPPTSSVCSRRFSTASPAIRRPTSPPIRMRRSAATTPAAS